jgi:tyrosinase
MVDRYTAPPLELPEGEGLDRADLIFVGLDHSGASFEARLFFDAPDADHAAGRDHPAYAGSFYLFGHGGCFGDEGHCDVAPRSTYDPRPPHALWPTRKVVIATDAIRKAVQAGSTMTITVVPVVLSTTDMVPQDEELPKFELVSVITYQ